MRQVTVVSLAFQQLLNVVMRFRLFLVDLLQQVISLRRCTCFGFCNFSRFEKLISLVVIDLIDLVLQALIQVHVVLNLALMSRVSCSATSLANVASHIAMAAAHKCSPSHHATGRICTVGTRCFSQHTGQLQILNFQILISRV
jgi:hypothetical protein